MTARGMAGAGGDDEGFILVRSVTASDETGAERSPPVRGQQPGG